MRRGVGPLPLERRQRQRASSASPSSARCTTTGQSFSSSAESGKRGAQLVERHLEFLAAVKGRRFLRHALREERAQRLGRRRDSGAQQAQGLGRRSDSGAQQAQGLGGAAETAGASDSLA